MTAKKLRAAVRTGRDRVLYRLSRRLVLVTLVDDDDLDTTGKLLLHNVTVQWVARERAARAAEVRRLNAERAAEDRA